jgi:hypothetical protein
MGAARPKGSVYHRRLTSGGVCATWTIKFYDQDGICHAKYAVSWWRWEELNLRHGAYETPALPLSYTAAPPMRGTSGRILTERAS